MQKQITLNPGESQRVSFLVAPAELGVYDVYLGGLVGSFEAIAAPTEWTEGVIIQSVSVSPSTAYLGQEVSIGIYIRYLDPLPLPATITGYVNVDGETLGGSWNIDFRNPTLNLKYITKAVGTYTITAQDKTATLTVLQGGVGTYYNPGGGTRMPLCTDILIPDVPPFSIVLQFTHPGGDLKYSDMAGGGISKFSSRMLPRASRGQLRYATPIRWTPSEAVVTDWVGYYYETLDYSIITIMALDYSCPEYWGSKEELARAMVGYRGNTGVPIPDEWVFQYGVTCPVCNGTGYTNTFIQRTCTNCHGLGKVLKVDLVRGIRDASKTPCITGIGFQGHVEYSVTCPYCNNKLQSGSISGSWGYEDKVTFMRRLLDHIETAHPEHPLTSPAWF
jgi:hypothetical protein